MYEDGPQREINYRTPGASEEHPFKYADPAAALAAQKKQREHSTHLSEASVFYVKAILLLGTLIMAYVIFRPQF